LDERIRVKLVSPDGEEELTVMSGTTMAEVIRLARPERSKWYPAVFHEEKVKELSDRIMESGVVELIPVDSVIGFDMYKRSLIFLTIKAYHDVMKETEGTHLISIMYSLGSGFFAKPKDDVHLTDKMIAKIKNRMRELAEKDVPFEKKTVRTSEVMQEFKLRGFKNKAKLMRYRRASRANLYCLDGLSDYFYGYLVPSAGYITEFDLVAYDDGFVICLPDRSTMKMKPYHAPEKLYRELRRGEDWGSSLGIEGVGELNDRISLGRQNELILMQEALMEKQIADIAETIRRENKRVVLIAGPSSSGKTTFSKRLSIQLMAIGMRPHAIEMDNFFVERQETPVNPDGSYDFECLEAVDLRLFGETMESLLAGKKTELPKFDFQTGQKKFNGDFLKMEKEDVLIVEGIHALNPASSKSLPQDSIFKIYISALTQLNLDEHNRISTSDTRLLRRMVRDARTRGHSPTDTIRMWESVRRGEEKNIFPFQEEADVMFNSALIYELSALKTYVEPLLYRVEPGTKEFFEAKRLLKFLDYFLGIDAEMVPRNSLLREFIGGGCF